MKKLTALHTKVRQLFSEKYVAAHDIKHIERVTGLAKKIAEGEGYNSSEAEAAALLHDVGRIAQEAEEGHAEAGEILAQQLLDTDTDLSPEEKKASPQRYPPAYQQRFRR
jgi:HD superfamily phosphodiesterase